jgi:DNA invertase Pin-like site-specific DNA recombinase
LAAARARGRKGGRPKGVDLKKQKAALALKQDGQYTIREICEIVGISRNTFYKYTRADETPRPGQQSASELRRNRPAPRSEEIDITSSAPVDHYRGLT